MSQGLTPVAFRTIWRLHFVVGLVVAPVLLVLAATGGVYLFDREIQAWWNRDMGAVVPAEASKPLAVQEEAVRAAFPGAAINGVVLPRNAETASEWSITLGDGRDRTVFVDPWRARITGDVDPAAQPIEIARRLHAGLMLEPFGRYLVEIAAGWTLVMVITGVALWWPRAWRWKGVLLPRLWSKGRAFWRDIHAIPAVLTAAFVAFLVISGMPWSIFWGKQFAQLGQEILIIAPSPPFGSAPHRASAPAFADETAREHHAGERVPWTIKHTQRPVSSGGLDIGIAQVERHLAGFDTHQWGPGLRIDYPRSPTDVFGIVYFPDKVEGQRTLYLDPGTGKILRDIAWRDYSPGAKAVEWSVVTHLGRQYGVVNQIVNLVVCLSIIAFVWSGLAMWWRRRPRQSLGVPDAHEEGDRLPRIVVASTLVIAAIFPLVGVTLLAFGALGVAMKRLRHVT